MWQLYSTTKTTNRRASELVNVKGIVQDYWRNQAGYKIKADARWEMLQFDSAVGYVGTVIENALKEVEETGMGNNKRWKAKYTPEQLLDPSFRLPVNKSNKTGGLDDLMKLPGIKVRR